VHINSIQLRLLTKKKKYVPADTAAS